MEDELLKPSPESRFIKVGLYKSVGMLCLSRPQAGNRITTEMLLAIFAQLDLWERDLDVSAVFMYADGPHFSVGTDFVTIRERMLQSKMAERFFAIENELIARIANYAKPIYSYAQGNCADSGLGLFAAAQHRMLARKTVATISATRIGFFPHAGIRWHLADAPGELGVYAAITGRPFCTQDSITIGLADLDIHAETPQTETTNGQSNVNERTIHSVLLDIADNKPFHGFPQGDCSEVAIPDEHDPSRITDLRDWIDEMFEGDDLTEIIGRLTQSSHPESEVVLEEIRSLSPLACHIALYGIREAETMSSIDRVLQQDMRVATNLLYKQSDFSEGVNAKFTTHNPHPAWLYPRIEDVPLRVVESFFR